MVCPLKYFCSGKTIGKKCTFSRFCRSKIVKNDDLQVFHVKDCLFSISDARLEIFYLKKHRIFHFFYSGNNIERSWRAPHVSAAAKSIIFPMLLPLQFFWKYAKKWQNFRNPYLTRSKITVFPILLPLRQKISIKKDRKIFLEMVIFRLKIDPPGQFSTKLGKILYFCRCKW